MTPETDTIEWPTMLHALAPHTVPCPTCGCTADKHDPQFEDLVTYRCRNAECSQKRFHVSMPMGRA